MLAPLTYSPLPHITAHHRRTYEAIFRHPVAHNLEWHDVLSFLQAIAIVHESNNGSLQVIRNGQMVLLHAPKHKDTPLEVILDIRRFLEASVTTTVTDSSEQSTASHGVVEDHMATESQLMFETHTINAEHNGPLLPATEHPR